MNTTRCLPISASCAGSNVSFVMHGVQGVGGSNPLIPTRKDKNSGRLVEKLTGLFSLHWRVPPFLPPTQDGRGEGGVSL